MGRYCTSSIDEFLHSRFYKSMMHLPKTECVYYDTWRREYILFRTITIDVQLAYAGVSYPPWRDRFIYVASAFTGLLKTYGRLIYG